MNKQFFLYIFILFFGLSQAQEKLSKEEKARRERNIQAGNPFVKYGSKAPVATLSKGKYLEVHDLDSIVTIGTMRWHVDNKQIVGHIVRDTLNPDAQPIGDSPGMWMSPDPLSEEFPDKSPYAFANNNPLRFTDPTGMAPEDMIPPDDFVFNEKGKYVRTVVNDKPDRLVIENSKTRNQDIYSFNDPKTDVASIKYNMNQWGEAFKDIKFINTLSDKDVNGMMKESGVEPKNWLSRNYFALTESVGGKMDFSVYHLSTVLAKNGTSHIWSFENEIAKDKGPLFIFPKFKSAFNLMDAGNLLWGKAMNTLGFSNSEAVDAATKYNKNDSKADIRAINTGFKL